MTSTTPLASSPIASFDLVVLDTPEPRKLAEFYCALLGWRIVREDDDWVTIRGDSSAGMAFQLAPDLVPPTWPDPAIPQQSHLDVTVADLDIGERGQQDEPDREQDEHRQDDQLQTGRQDLLGRPAGG
jgi:catechol 2,3-dioxygenase-like lactoylglutathione lyase family enzyme